MNIIEVIKENNLDFLIKDIRTVEICLFQSFKDIRFYFYINKSIQDSLEWLSFIESPGSYFFPLKIKPPSIHGYIVKSDHLIARNLFPENIVIRKVPLDQVDDTLGKLQILA